MLYPQSNLGVWHMPRCFFIFWIPTCNTIIHISPWWHTNLLLVLIIWWYVPHTWHQSKKHQPWMKKAPNLFLPSKVGFFYVEYLVRPGLNIKTLLHLKHNPPVSNITNQTPKINHNLRTDLLCQNCHKNNFTHTTHTKTITTPNNGTLSTTQHFEKL